MARGMLKVNRVRKRRIHSIDFNEQERELDRQIEIEDNLSVMVMAFILIGCFIVGIFLGYMLYNIAINGGM